MSWALFLPQHELGSRATRPLYKSIYVFVCICIYVCLHVHMKVRGHSYELVLSFHFYMSFGDQTQVLVRLGVLRALTLSPAFLKIYFSLLIYLFILHPNCNPTSSSLPSPTLPPTSLIPLWVSIHPDTSSQIRTKCLLFH